MSNTHPKIEYIYNKLSKLKSFSLLFDVNYDNWLGTIFLKIKKKGKPIEERIIYKPNFSIHDEPVKYYFRVIHIPGLLFDTIYIVGVDEITKRTIKNCPKYNETCYFGEVNINNITDFIINTEYKMRYISNSNYVAYNDHLCAKCRNVI